MGKNNNVFLFNQIMCLLFFQGGKCFSKMYCWQTLLCVWLFQMAKKKWVWVFFSVSIYFMKNLHQGFRSLIFFCRILHLSLKKFDTFIPKYRWHYKIVIIVSWTFSFRRDHLLDLIFMISMVYGKFLQFFYKFLISYYYKQ